jgi:hypothetical protein
MAYSITYSKNNEQINIEWIVPTGWTTAAIRQSFERQYPQAEIIKLEALL